MEVRWFSSDHTCGFWTGCNDEPATITEPLAKFQPQSQIAQFRDIALAVHVVRTRAIYMLVLAIQFVRGRGRHLAVLLVPARGRLLPSEQSFLLRRHLDWPHVRLQFEGRSVYPVPRKVWWPRGNSSAWCSAVRETFLIFRCYMNCIPYSWTISAYCPVENVTTPWN